MNNKKLFEEAIAEAKSIREAAIANAKEALEESLTPQIKSLLAQRLNEMEEEDDKLPEPPEEKLPVMEAEEEEEESEEEEGSEEEGSEEDEQDIENMSVDELKDLIRDIVGQMVDQGGEEGLDMGMEPEMGTEEPAGEGDQEEEIDLDELLAELSMDEPGMEAPIEEAMDPQTVEMLAAIIGPVLITGGAFALDKAIRALKAGKAGKAGQALADELEKAGSAAGSTLRRDGKSINETEVSEAIDPQSLEMIAAAIGPLLVGGSAFAIDKVMNALKAGKAGKAGQALAGQLEKAGSAAGASLRRDGKAFEEVQSELFEAKKSVKKLTESLQEVNLLNAKLLFVNKVLKENKHLSDVQVANVIATFDKAKTSREAKLVYESFTTTFHKKSNAPVVESKLKGLASKAAGKAPVKTEVITEVSDAVKRMQKLAGIIKG
jgi:hypothetical protein